MSKATYGYSDSGTLNINVKVDARTVFLLGGVVYIAARTAVRRELKRDPKVQNIFHQVVDTVKETWNEAEPKGPVVVQREATAAKASSEQNTAAGLAKDMREQGHSISQIATEMELDESTVRNLLNSGDK